VRAVAQDDAVRAEVADQGPGIPAADREAIFAPFFTTKEHGTGLGLAIARQFAEAHRGRLFVEPNHTGRGASVVFQLPLWRDGVPEMPG
jgi:signal transduction histidine kinase